ncbi:hypothetical protein RDABS01_019526 [Bienertia sinuspersici]
MPSTVKENTILDESMKWHQRLGHVPMKRISKIDGIKEILCETEDVCMVCPMAKFTKLPYKPSN